MKKIVLLERDLPKKWYNILPDLPEPLAPPLHPVTKQPITPDDLAPLFAEALIMQEVSQEREIPIPEEILKAYTMWRPTPLIRAERLERFLDTPARIYYKYEAASPAGSHKPNTAVAQAYYNKIEGINRLTTETGAGQWGSALAFAGSLFDIKVTVYMVKVSYEQKPLRKTVMNLWGAEVFPSPSPRTQSGQKILAQDPNSPGSLGIAISEAVEDAVNDPKAHYTLGSVLNHVLLHQTVIGEEVKLQLEKGGERLPDVIIGCVGGGSNFGGIAIPFVREKLEGKKDMRIVAVEPYSCPTLTKGIYAYDFGDTVGLTPLIKMYTLGHDFIPPAIHAGGLRYHGDAPIVCNLVKNQIVEAVAYHQNECFEAAKIFAATEGYIPAPETSHAVKAAIVEALKAKEEKQEKVIVFNFSGHGLLDLASYEKFLGGDLEDYEYPQELVDAALHRLPKVE